LALGAWRSSVGASNTPGSSRVATRLLLHPECYLRATCASPIAAVIRRLSIRRVVVLVAVGQWGV
jgi:hypothetical protein